MCHAVTGQRMQAGKYEDSNPTLCVKQKKGIT